LREQRFAPIWPTLRQIVAEEFAVSSEAITQRTPLSYSEFTSQSLKQA
jgi:hypothetical protein